MRTRPEVLASVAARHLIVFAVGILDAAAAIAALAVVIVAVAARPTERCGLAARRVVGVDVPGTFGAVASALDVTALAMVDVAVGAVGIGDGTAAIAHAVTVRAGAATPRERRAPPYTRGACSYRRAPAPRSPADGRATGHAAARDPTAATARALTTPSRAAVRYFLTACSAFVRWVPRATAARTHAAARTRVAAARTCVAAALTCLRLASGLSRTTGVCRAARVTARRALTRAARKTPQQQADNREPTPPRSHGQLCPRMLEMSSSPSRKSGHLDELGPPPWNNVAPLFRTPRA